MAKAKNRKMASLIYKNDGAASKTKMASPIHKNNSESK